MEIEPQVFRAWLVMQPEGAEVGRACVSWSCPLARFLGEMCGGKWIVGPDGLGWYVDGYPCEWQVVPEWVRRFIVSVDLAAELHGPIFREVALAVLDEVLVKVQEVS